MDPIALLRSGKYLFLIAGLFSFLVAMGVVSAPQLAAPITAVSGVDVQGASVPGAESVVWVYNPDLNMVHFELTLSNIRTYNVSVYTDKVSFPSAEGKYELSPFTMRFDLSNLRTAVPMQSALRSQSVYRYEFVDCTREVEPNPQDVFTYLINTVNPANLVSGLYGISIQDIADSIEFQRVLAESWRNCRDFYATKYPPEDVYVFLGIKSVKRSVVIPVVNITVASYDFPVPDFFAVVKEPVPTSVVRASASVYPVGSVKFYLTGEKGTYMADVTINSDELSGDVIEKQVSESFGNVFFSFFALSRGDFFPDGDPIIFKWPGADVAGYRLIYTNDYARAQDIARQIDVYVSGSITEARELLIGRASDVADVAFRLTGTFSDSVSLTQTVKSKLQALITQYNTSIEQSSKSLSDVGATFNGAVLILSDNPVDAGYMKLRFVGDLKASYIGLTYIEVKPKISSVSVDKGATTTQPLVVSFTLRNLSDVPGTVEVTATCTKLGKAQTFVNLPANGEVSGSLTIYSSDLGEPVTDTCTLTACNVTRTNCDTKQFTANYVPDLKCDPGSMWCSSDGTAIVKCADPLKGTTEVIPCGEGKTCVTEQGVPKCVSSAQPKEGEQALLCNCVGSNLVCYDPVIKQYQTTSCPNGCVYTPEGAQCREGGVAPPPKPEPNVVRVDFRPSDTPVRIGFGIIGFALVLLGVIL